MKNVLHKHWIFTIEKILTFVNASLAINDFRAKNSNRATYKLMKNMENDIRNNPVNKLNTIRSSFSLLFFSTSKSDRVKLFEVLRNVRSKLTFGKRVL